MTNTMLIAPEKAQEFFAWKLDFTVDPLELNRQINNSENITIIDVRAAKDFIRGHLPRAINLPAGNWDKISGWRKERPLVVYCYSQTCHLAAHAAVEFARQGLSVREMEGGFETWRKNKLPVEI
jgi:rhodanese-related sulfurtransferase